nr:SusC/RagA family TonB-linked outer membrane protein [Mucilaginibacter sp. L294]
MNRQFYKLALSVIFTFLIPMVILAQDTPVTGLVKSVTDGSVIPGATVSAKNQHISTLTDVNGYFKINVPSGTVLTISYIGYLSQNVTVSGSSPINVVLQENINALNEVVVTGLASGIKRSNLANAVTSISAKELTGTAPPQTVDNALYGKIPGAQIRANSGAPGGGISILLRGVSTLQGSSQPLYIIDGVYLNNNTLSTGRSSVTGAGASSQDDSGNRLADINADDIDKIEVLKGASASAIYGTRANAGVIIITTKKGKAGKTKVSFGQDLGFSTIQKYVGSASWDTTKIKQFFPASRQALELQRYADAGGKVYDYEKILYGEKPLITNTHLNISGGGDKTTFYVSGDVSREGGIIKHTGFDRNSLRLNLDHKLNKWIDFSVNSNYLNTNSDRGFTGNENNAGGTLGYIIGYLPNYYNPNPVNGIYPDNPYSENQNPLALRDKAINNVKINRFIESATANLRFIQTEHTSLKLSLQGGVDYLNQKSKEYFPEDLQAQRSTANPGNVILGTESDINTNLQGFLIYGQDVNKTHFTTQVGVVALQTQVNTLFGQGRGLVASQQSLAQASVQSVTQSSQIVKDLGWVGQEEINFDDKIIGTVGLRLDKSTLNGDANHFYAFPKASVAINLTKFDFWKSETISQFKLRTAYGQTGGLPPYGSIYSSLSPVITGGLIGSVISSTVGNPDIRPERAGELELGADIGFFKDRLVFEGTYYNKHVNDLIQDLTLAGSTGLSTEKVNAASLVNRGVEVSLTGIPFSGQGFTWTSRILFSRNTSKITKLDVPSYTTGVYGVSYGTYLIKEGYSPTTIVGTPQISPGIYTVYGNSQPEFQSSWYNDFSFLNGFSLTALWDWKKGGKILNITEYNTDNGGTTPDFNTNGAARKNNPTAANYVQDASYVKLREVGFSYNFSKNFLHRVLGNVVQQVRVGLSATNLLNFSPYKGYSPEVSNFGSASAINSGTDLFQYPPSKRLLFNLKVDF